MKFLLLFIGLVCYILGAFLMKNAERKKAGMIWLILGASFMIAGFSYLQLGFVCAIIAIVFVLNNYIYYHDEVRWWMGIIFYPAVILVLFFAAIYFPTVTLDNEAIKVSGKYGGIFKISDMQSVDTVSVYPKIVRRRNGSNPPAIHLGNFDLAKEKQQSKLYIYLNNPPYINIRMNDNRLILLNFKEPDKTVEFYDRLKNIINSN